MAYLEWIKKNRSLRGKWNRPFNKASKGKGFSPSALLTLLSVPAILLGWLWFTMNSATKNMRIKENQEKIISQVDQKMIEYEVTRKMDLIKNTPTPVKLVNNINMDIKDTEKRLKDFKFYQLPAVNNIENEVNNIENENTKVKVNNLYLSCTECFPHDIVLNIRSYNPKLLGMNCWLEKNGVCVSPMYSGIDWRYGWGWAAACPFEFPLGTIIYNELGSFVCMDRGGEINCKSGTCVIDLLTDLNINIDGMESTIWLAN